MQRIAKDNPFQEIKMAELNKGRNKSLEAPEVSE